MQAMKQQTRTGKIARVVAFGTVLATGLMLPRSVNSLMNGDGSVVSGTDARPRSVSIIETSELDGMKKRINDLEMQNRGLKARVRRLKAENEELKERLDTGRPEMPPAEQREDVRLRPFGVFTIR